MQKTPCCCLAGVVSASYNAYAQASFLVVAHGSSRAPLPTELTSKQYKVAQYWPILTIDGSKSSVDTKLQFNRSDFFLDEGIAVEHSRTL